MNESQLAEFNKRWIYVFSLGMPLMEYIADRNEHTLDPRTHIPRRREEKKPKKKEASVKQANYHKENKARINHLKRKKYRERRLGSIADPDMCAEKIRDNLCNDCRHLRRSTVDIYYCNARRYVLAHQIMEDGYILVFRFSLCKDFLYWENKEPSHEWY